MTETRNPQPPRNPVPDDRYHPTTDDYWARAHNNIGGKAGARDE